MLICHREEPKRRRGDPENLSAYAGLLRFARNDFSNTLLRGNDRIVTLPQLIEKLCKVV